MENFLQLDTSKLYRNEKITNRCFSYCIRELVQKTLFDYEEECLRTCATRLNEHFDYFLNESMSVFKNNGESQRKW